MEYFVTFKVEARYQTCVKSESLEAAIEEASRKYSEADFGEAYDIDGEEVLVEDTHGNVLLDKRDRRFT